MTSPHSLPLGKMDEWHDVLPCLRTRQLVWWGQCSALCSAIADRDVERAQWKKKGLSQCAEHGDVEGVKYLVERCEADVHAEDNFALYCASASDHLNVVRYLVENGADVHARNDDAL